VDVHVGSISLPAPATPEPPAEPTTTAAPPPPTASAPQPTGPPTATAPTPTEAPTTTAAPSTTVAPTPAAPSVVYSANAECDPATGQTTVSFRLTNTGDTPVQIITTTAGVPLEPNPIPAFGSASATRTLDGPDNDRQVTITATIDGGSAGQIQLSDDITAAACQGPGAPPEVTFTFTVTPSESRAAVDDTVE
jgi:hypothetical protein